MKTCLICFTTLNNQHALYGMRLLHKIIMTAKFGIFDGFALRTNCFVKFLLN